MLELITSENFRNLCQYNWRPGNELPPNKSLVHVNNNEIDSFFRDILENYCDNEYTIVSANSDTNTVYSKFYNPLRDAIEYGWPTPLNNYGPLIIRERIDHDRCLKRDKYSLRNSSFTYGTFPIIPKNIKKWYLTNSDIIDNRIVNITHGVHDKYIEILEKIIKEPEEDKIEKVLICFNNTTKERMLLKEYIGNHQDFVILDNLSQEDFYRATKRYKYVLCPEGVGFDTYRISEAIYLGSIPIILSNKIWTKFFEDLPTIIINNINDLSQGIKNYNLKNYNLEKMFINYWKNQIYQI